METENTDGISQDTDRDIIVSVGNRKYCDNFNVTIEDQITARDLVANDNKENQAPYFSNQVQSINADDPI